MINKELRERVGYDPEGLFRRSQEAYRRAYQRGEIPSWSKHPLPAGVTDEFIKELKKIAGEAIPDILDIGCGDGNKSEKLAERGLTIVGVDYEEDAVSKAQVRAVNLQVKNRLIFLQGDARRLVELFPQNRFHGIFDYQCLASIPPEYWKEIGRGYYEILKPGGLLFMDLLNIEGPQFHGDISEQLAESHEYAFEYDPDNPTHNGLDWENGLYIYLFDEKEADSIFGEHFSKIVLQKRYHPYNEKRILWSVLMRSKKQ